MHCQAASSQWHPCLSACLSPPVLIRFNVLDTSGRLSRGLGQRSTSLYVLQYRVDIVIVKDCQQCVILLALTVNSDDSEAEMLCQKFTFGWLRHVIMIHITIKLSFSVFRPCWEGCLENMKTKLSSVFELFMIEYRKDSVNNFSNQWSYSPRQFLVIQTRTPFQAFITLQRQWLIVIVKAIAWISIH